MRRSASPALLGAAAALLACPGGARAQAKLEIDRYTIEAPSDAIAKEKAKELAWSASVFGSLFAQDPPKGRVVLSQSPGSGGLGMPSGSSGGAAWTLPWFAGSLPGMPAGASAAGGMKALTHEAAHLQLVHLVNDGCSAELKRSFNGYGSYLPDWVDEAVAVYHEPDGQKAMRRQQLKAILGKHIPFSRLFTMDHPIGGNGMSGLPPGMPMPGGGGVGGGVLGPDQAEKMQGANDFYVETLSVIEYLVDRSGAPFFRFCVHQLQQGHTMDQVLEDWYGLKKTLARLEKESKKQARKRGGDDEGEGGRTIVRGGVDERLAGVLRVQPGETLGRLPRTVDDLEKDWMRWVAARYPGYRPELPPSPE